MRFFVKEENKIFVSPVSQVAKKEVSFDAGFLALSLTLLFVLEFAFFLPSMIFYPNDRFTASVLPAVIVDYANEDRSKDNLSPLVTNPLLEKAAQLKAEDMAHRGYFSHNSPEGKLPWVWLDQVGYNYVYAGENLAVNFYDSKDINDAWMNSPKHRDNILRSDFQEIGIGVAKGNFRGRDSYFIVQFLGSSAESLAVQKPMEKIGHLSNAASVSGLTFLAGNNILALGKIFTIDFWSKAVASPRNTVNLALTIFIFAVMLLIVFMSVRKKRSDSYPKFLVNSLCIITIALVLITLNSYLSFKDSTVFSARIENGSY